MTTSHMTTSHMTTSHMTTSHEVDREYRGYREYRPVGEAAEPKSVVKALALIIGAAFVVGAGAVAGCGFSVYASAYAAACASDGGGRCFEAVGCRRERGSIPASRSSVIIRV